MPRLTSFPDGRGPERGMGRVWRRFMAGCRRAAGVLGDVARRDCAESPVGEDPLAHAVERAMRVPVWARRRVYDGLRGVPDGVRLGWAQLPGASSRGFSIGAFDRRGRFAQMAFADGQGRVFLGSDPNMDTWGTQPDFLFTKEASTARPDTPHGRPHDIVGGMVGRDSTGDMIWLAAWRRTGGSYTLEQLREPLPEALRTSLEYRDAVALGFLVAYLVPRHSGSLWGFGSGNIFRRLNRESPMGAIRRSVEDARVARSRGLRVSGLEEYFIDLMGQAGALDPMSALEPVHGAEPLHLFASSYSGSYILGWNSSLPFPAILRSLRIEGNLNRFAAVSTCLEYAARGGSGPSEDTVTHEEAARIDAALLLDPALIALRPRGDEPLDPLHDDGIAPVIRLVSVASRTSRMIAQEDPSTPDAYRHGASAGSSEWVYRQTMARILRTLRLPYRFDVEFRDDLRGGNVALGFTTAGLSMMPMRRYDDSSRRWIDLTEEERAAMSADYNLRVGLIMAAIGFGADRGVSSVSLHIDSLGLEEAVAEQDCAIESLMSQALAAFESMRTTDHGFRGSKADPKDGDLHGDSVVSSQVGDAIRRGDLSSDQDSADSHDDHGAHDSGDGEGGVDRRFEELVRDAQIDEVAFSVPTDNGPDGTRTDGKSSDDGDVDQGGEMGPGTSSADGAEDPLAALRRNPTVRNVVTVTFTRRRFMRMLRTYGLTDPRRFYQSFEASMDVDEHGGLRPVDADFDLRDARFAPAGAQEEPEFSDVALSDGARGVLGVSGITGLSIQRVDLLQRAVTDLHHLAASGDRDSVSRAQKAIRIIDAVGDPELREMSSEVGGAIIDGQDTPDPVFSLSKDLDSDRVKARDLLFSGHADEAVDHLGKAVLRVDEVFASAPGVPRYFNSYAERVVYNRLFATPDERTVLIPDNLFYAHIELADVLSQMGRAEAALSHLNALVAYAPAYPLSHMKLAIQLARREDWDSARAACLNALRVCLDRDDAAFAYYRFAYAAWMRDEFSVAAAAYMVSGSIAPGHISALDGELQELMARMRSQHIRVPVDLPDAQDVLEKHGVPVWPRTEVSHIVRSAARVCVDEGLFVPARTLSLAAARMEDADVAGLDLVQMQFLRSLNA
ncbi:tetratricopeptide repeat protein [uncultured Bifidobacterium sp.]|uniref:tetratricopeptide repeat protein n=1 Tax=uncultured Bifidobacterium sp. TaxID=165187 RepID=UPI00261C5FBF|nr:tetratricopeptide repeat protein [uncultured Bifidobacterium sp.]